MRFVACRWLVPLSVVFCSNLLSVPDGPPVHLRYRLKPGQVLKFTATHKEVFREPGDGSGPESRCRAKYEWTWKVESIDPQGNYHITHKFTSYSLKAKMLRAGKPDDKSANNKVDEIEKDFKKEWKAILGRRMKLVVKANGSIAKITFPMEFIAPNNKQEGRSNIRRGIGAEIAVALRWANPVVPRKPKRVGDSWKSKLKGTDFHRYVIAFTNTLRRTRKTKVGKTATIDIIPVKRIIRTGLKGYHATVRSQKGVGVAVFNVTNGRLQELSVKLRYEIDGRLGQFKLSKTVVEEVWKVKVES